MRKKKKSLKKFHNVIILALLVIIVLLTIGYAHPVRELSLGGASINVRPVKDIRITNISSVSYTSGASSSNDDYSVNSIISDITLPQANSTVTLSV